MRRPTFAERIAPQLTSVDVGRSRLFGDADAVITPFGTLERIMRPVMHDAVAHLGRFSPAPAALARRLAQAGRNQSVVDFRAEQILWAGLALAASTALVLLAAVAGSLNPVFAVMMIGGTTASAFMLRDYLLTVQIRRRETRMLAEFPGLAELMALAVGSGESAAGALERVCRLSSGELAAEFGRVLAENRSGTPLIPALQAFSARTQLAPLARFVDGITVAVERGTPLADVLRAQAQDVRDLAKRNLMESAGRKEIAIWCASRAATITRYGQSSHLRKAISG
jgi:tight adherence protein C